jgi:hypothetical protein
MHTSSGVLLSAKADAFLLSRLLKKISAVLSDHYIKIRTHRIEKRGLTVQIRLRVFVNRTLKTTPSAR